MKSTLLPLLIIVLTLIGCASARNSATVQSTASPQPDQPTSPEWHWRDARTLRVEGRGWPDATPFCRLPDSAQSAVPPAVWNLSRHSAGVCVRFITDSTSIAAIWDGGGAMPHMAATANSGLDLYARSDGLWVFRGVAKPKLTRTTATLATNLPSNPTEYLLYLPLYNNVTDLQIGVTPGARLEPAPLRIQRPIVFYGTSITQGGCAARSGMCHAAILGRHLNREIINLGFSGAGKMEPALADLLAQLDPALYVLECLPNMTAEMTRERFAPFVRRLRDQRPDTPILLVEHPIYPQGADRNELLREILNELTAEGVPNLHRLPGKNQLAGRENGTVDGIHPTDLGFTRMANVYEPILREILKASD